MAGSPPRKHRGRVDAQAAPARGRGSTRGPPGGQGTVTGEARLTRFPLLLLIRGCEARAPAGSSTRLVHGGSDRGVELVEFQRGFRPKLRLVILSRQLLVKLLLQLLDLAEVLEVGAGGTEVGEHGELLLPLPGVEVGGGGLLLLGRAVEDELREAGVHRLGLVAVENHLERKMK